MNGTDCIELQLTLSLFRHWVVTAIGRNAGLPWECKRAALANEANSVPLSIATGIGRPADRRDTPTRFPFQISEPLRSADVQYTEAGEPKGFDSVNDVALADALESVMQMHKSAKPCTVRKFLVGIAIHGNESGISVFAERYEESYVRLDRPEADIYRAQPERLVSIPCDFWRIGMAINADASGCFAASNLGHITEMTGSELPYRMRDRTSSELHNERVRLSQLAWGVHFPRRSLLALAEDPNWQAWGNVASTLQNRGRRGRPQAWKWDEAKAALTIEAARNPEILRGGTGPIVQFINNEMRQMHFEQLPDIKDVEAYARRFSGLWSEPDLGPPRD